MKKKYTESHRVSSLVILEAKCLGLILLPTSYETCHSAYHNQRCLNGTAFHLLRNLQLRLLPITKGQNYPTCQDRGKERPEYLAPSITTSQTPQLFLVSIYSWKNTKLQIFSNMEHCLIVSTALSDRFCGHWSGR